MALKDKVPSLLEHIKNNAEYLEQNKIVLDIFQGNLKKYVLEDMKNSLSNEYFDKIKNRAVPINVLTRLIDKMSKAYADAPIRTVEGSTSDKELVDSYVDKFQMDVKGNTSEEFSHLFKGYCYEPFMHRGEPKLRVLAFDKFLPYSDDLIDPTYMTVLIKIIGERDVEIEYRNKPKVVKKKIYFAYSDDEFYAFDEDGDPYYSAMAENEGINPIEEIPFVYGSRSRDKLLPVQDSDTLSLTKVIPVLMSDLSGTIMYQCFSVIWGVDIDFEEMVYSPNAIWSLKSDSDSDKTPQVGTLKPEADIDKVMKYVMNTFVFWLETRGIKAGSMGQLDSGNLASGIAKVIDEMDTTDIRKVSIQYLKSEEEAFWKLMKSMHNHWVDSGQITGEPRFTENFEVSIEFDDPKPYIDRETEVRIVKGEIDAGFLPPENGLKELYPDLDDNEIKERLVYYREVNSQVITEKEIIDDGADEGEDQDT